MVLQWLRNMGVACAMVFSLSASAGVIADAAGISAIGFQAARDKAPTVNMTAPLSGANFTTGSTITLTATASDSDGTVSKVAFYRGGSTLIGTATASPYSIAWANVAAGSYSLTAVATDNSGASTTSGIVTITVTTPTDQPPTVAVTSPANNALLAAPASFTIGATAGDSDGTISKVAFYDGATLLGTVNGSGATLNATWPVSNLAAGTHLLKAVATDNAGLNTTSTPVSVVIDTPPLVSLTSPGSCSTPTAPATINLAAEFDDPDGAVVSIAFYANGALVGINTLGAPGFVGVYRSTYQWDNVPIGTYSLTAVATDNMGLSSTSSPMQVTVSSRPAPVVGITSPASGTTVVLGTALAIAATATNSDNTVAKVDFYANGALLGSSTASPYSINWTPSVAGNVSLTAVATDTVGLTATSAAILVVVDGPPAPTILSITPTSGTVGTEVTINGTNLFAGSSLPPPTVAFNHVLATVTSASPTKVTAIVPNGATSGPISLSATANGPVAYSSNFNVIQPGSGVATVVITGVSPEPSIVNQAYTVSVTVTPTSATGTVLVGDQTSSCWIDLPATSCTLGGEPAVGEVGIYAIYSGDANFASATSATFAHITNPATATEMCGLDPATIPNDPLGFVPITQLSGVVYTPGLVQDITGNGNLSVTVTSPSANATTADASVDVTGTFVGPTNTGITVNGMVASTVNGQFLASGVPLSAGTNTVTVTATTLTGATAMTSTSITQGGTSSSPLSFTVDGQTGASGFAPKTVTFNLVIGTLPNGAAVQSVAIDPDGSGTYPYTATTLTALPSSFIYSYPSRHTAAFKVIDNQGHTYVAYRTVLIEDHVAQRYVMCDVYSYLKSRLNAQDATGASNAYQSTVQSQYQSLFTALGTNMPPTAQILGNIADGFIGRGYAEMTLVRDNTNQTRSGYPLRMTLGADGVWRISGM